MSADARGPGRREGHVQYIRWALGKSGPGCEECLYEWAVNEEARLRGLVGVALARPDAAGIRSLSERARATTLPDLMSPDEYRSLVSAAFPLLAPNHDLVEVRITGERPGRFARDRRVRGILSEISRVPAFALKRESVVITAAGEVLKASYESVREDTVTRVLVDPGRPVVIKGYFEGSSGGYGAEGAPPGFDLSSGNAADLASNVLWPLLLADLADEIP